MSNEVWRNEAGRVERLSIDLGLGSFGACLGRACTISAEFSADGSGSKHSQLKGTVVGVESVYFLAGNDLEIRVSVSNRSYFGSDLLYLVGYIHPIEKIAAWSAMLLMFDEDRQRWKRKSVDCRFVLI